MVTSVQFNHTVVFGCFWCIPDDFEESFELLLRHVPTQAETQVHPTALHAVTIRRACRFFR